MLNIFRRKDIVTRAVVGSILVLIAVAMVITLIPGILDPTTTGAVPSALVAEVRGEEITSSELQQKLFQISRQSNIPPMMMPLYYSSILNQMVLEKATMQEAKRLGLQISTSEWREKLEQDPTLFPGGQFIGQQQYENIMAANGMTVAQFEQSYRDAMLNEKLRRVVTDPVSVTPEEVIAAFHRENEKVVLDYVFLRPVDFRNDIRPSEAELEAYFEENRDSYPVPEKRSVQILYVEKQKVREATSVAEEEIQEYYDSNKDSYRVEERVLVSHILLRTPDKTPDKLDEVRQKASGLLEQLKGGADFATLAKENSEDQTTAPSGGDLGWVVRNQTVPEFENAAFTLEPGTVSELIETLYGIHILKVNAHDQPYLRTLEQVKPEIQNKLLEEKVASGILDLAEQATVALRRSPDDIESLAERYNGVVVAPAPFARGAILPRVGNSPEFMEEVFSLETGEVAPPILGPDGYAVPLLLEVIPGHAGEYAEVQDQVRENYISGQSREMAQAKAEELSKRLELQETKDIGLAARELDLTVETTQPVARQGTIPSLGNVEELGPQAFTAEVGEVVGPESAGGGYVVYQVASREPAQEEDMEQQVSGIMQRLLNQKRQLAFEAFQDSLTERLAASGDLRIYEDVLAQLTASVP